MSKNLLSPTTTNSSSQVSATKDQSYATDEVGPNPDTIHFLSPATTARTLCEGDFDYTQFAPIFSRYNEDALYSESSISCYEAGLHRTIAIIKPEAMIYKDVVLKEIFDNGLSIIGERTLHLTPEQVAELYAQHYGCPIFPNMVVSTSLGPLLVLSLAGLNAVEKWKSMIGPCKTLQPEWFYPINVRTRFGMNVDMTDVLHASENLKQANKENRFFYPRSTLDPITCEELKVQDYCNLYINPTLSKGLAQLIRQKPVDPILFLAEWLLLNDPFQPNAPYSYAMAPT